MPLTTDGSLMTTSDWCKLSRTFGIAFTILILVALLYLTGFHVGRASGYHQGQADRSAELYSRDPQTVVKDCAALSSQAAAIQCGYGAAKASQENQREEYELAAQRDMVTFGWVGLGISVLSLFATIIGAIFIYQQIVLTRRAVKETSDATVAMQTSNSLSNPPKLIASNFAVWEEGDASQSAPALKEGAKLAARFYLVNAGHSPAEITDEAGARLKRGDPNAKGNETWYGDLWADELPMIRPYELSRKDMIAPTVLRSGANLCCELSTTVPPAVAGKQPNLHILGCVEYWNNGTRYMTLFCKKYDARRKCFVNVDGRPEYDSYEGQ